LTWVDAGRFARRFRVGQAPRAQRARAANAGEADHMPVLQGALLCDAAREYNGLVSILGGFVSTVGVQTLPIPAPIWFAGRIAFRADEVDVAHQISVTATDDAGNELARINGGMPPQNPAQLPVPELMGGINLIFPIPFPIMALGLYWVELVVDGVSLARLPLMVIPRAAG
jgi:hypothetical protein